MRHDDEVLNDSWLLRSMERSERSDPDFKPKSDDADTMKVTVATSADQSKGRTLLVYESKLKQLFSKCLKCGSFVHDIKELKRLGSQYKVSMECLNGCSTSWSSQPELDSTVGAASLMVTAAAELVGIPFSKLKRFAYVLNLKFIEKSTFYRLRGDYVFPAIDHAWKVHQQNLVAELRAGKLNIGIDGQCDTPRHNATYCTVTAMDCTSNKVVEVQVVNVKDVKNSQGMEKEGLVRVVDSMENNLNLNIRLISTDRHIQIRKMMASNPRYAHIIHQFDPWHLAKNISKKLTKLAKKKENRPLAPWIQHGINFTNKKR